MPTLPLTFAVEPRYKEQFAKSLSEGFTPFVAAMRIWPTDAGLASAIAGAWPTDPYVQACLDKLKTATEDALKPANKIAQIKRIESRLSSMDDTDYVRAERLIAEMAGYIDRPAPAAINIDNRQQTIERVLVIKDHGTDDEWEKKMTRQQSKLIEGNT